MIIVKSTVNNPAARMLELSWMLLDDQEHVVVAYFYQEQQARVAAAVLNGELARLRDEVIRLRNLLTDISPDLVKS